MATLEVLPRTVWQENAALAATSDRGAHTDMVLDVACKDAIADLRSGRLEEAIDRLLGAGERAERVLGRTGGPS